jgi:hypothetical protein
VQLRDRRQDLEAAGARIVLVGTGTPDQAARFADAWAEGLPVYSDVSRRTFAAAGMKRGLSATLHPRLLWNAWRALRSGFRQTKVEGDPWQQGGVLVIALDGAPRVLHEQIDSVGGDTIDVERLLADLRAA